MKRVLTLIAIVVVLSVGCLAGCSKLSDYGSAAIEELAPALEDADGLPSRALGKLAELFCKKITGADRAEED